MRTFRKGHDHPPAKNDKGKPLKGLRHRQEKLFGNLFMRQEFQNRPSHFDVYPVKRSVSQSMISMEITITVELNFVIGTAKFAEDYQYQYKIVSGDDTTCMLNCSINRHNCTYQAPDNPHVTTEHQLKLTGVIVLCGLSAFDLTESFFLSRTVNCASYLNLLCHASKR